MFVTRSTTRLRAAVAMLILALTALVAGCGADSEATDSAGTREVQTERGPVQVPADPQRIVVLNGALAGYLYDLEAPVAAADPRLLGVNTRTGGFPAAWAEDAKAQGTVELPIGDNINLEFIANQRPDLIIGGGQGFPAQQSINAYDQLSAIAPTVLVPATTTDWADQLRLVAEVVGRPDKVDALITAYQDKVAKVKESVKAPAGAVAFVQSVKSGEPTLFLPTAALPRLLAEVGFTIDDKVAEKAGNPAKPEAADWFHFSPELLSTVVDAPVVFVVSLSGGRDAAQLGQDPLYAQLPAFKSGNVFELPASSARPDYRSVMDTLDLIAERFK
ncbi:ABC transporter substrate-binding protein [Nocardia cyriacigeorgica]|uniref:ABC transporter substrate-binding protein n=1 Tax=Nocardia cyriacigeorgica TaxID=135487 RepID=UPI0018931161|nr:ABC transporter substrate-binding protein [Nocardia cyriacigeorgica]MBF6285635.1 ABC transporter substrate-binding protein [Nocardia cyriacigeorgica]